MSLRSIRIMSAALVVVFILTGLALPGAAWARDENQKQLPLIFPNMFPNKTALDLMQLGKDYLNKKKIEASLKAGKKIEYGQLSVTSQPEGAGVLVSSYVPLGKTPYTNHKLLPGLQRVTVRKDGYYERVRMVEIKPNQQSDLEFKLKPIPYARLTVKLRPPSTKVKIVDVEEPYTPGMKLVPGRYLVSLSHPMYGEKRLCAVLKGNEDLILNGDLAAKHGKIKIELKQPDATVYLDGREVLGHHGTTRELVVISGPHKIQAWKSLFKPVSKIVQVKHHETTTVKVDLARADHFTNSVGMEFVKIPAGKFMMGFNSTPEYLAERLLDKRGYHLKNGYPIFFMLFKNFPRHLVEITRPFFMQTTEVTNAQWDKVMGGDSAEEKAQLPKVRITIKEANDFVEKLNALEEGKHHYRLPTEAEWEYAAKAGSKSFFNFGDSITTDQANFLGQPSSHIGWSFGENRGHLTKVKSFPPNPWGLYDMHGNASEQCADQFDILYYTKSPIKDPICISQGNGNYATRGGSYSSGWNGCMSAKRSHSKSGDDFAFGDYRDNGFRVIAEKVNGGRCFNNLFPYGGVDGNQSTILGPATP